MFIKNILRMFLTAILLSGISNADKLLDKNSLKSIKTKSKILKYAKMEITKGMDLGTLYMLEGRSRGKVINIFITKDFKTTIVGAGFDENGRKIEFLIDMKPYTKKALWKTGNGKKEYFLFTDPQCPYCKRFEQNLKHLKKDITLYVFLLPLDFHNDSRAMSRYILSKKSSKQRAKAMQDIINGDTSYKTAKYSKKESKKLDEMIDESIQISQKLNIRGTPSVLDINGKQIMWTTLFNKEIR